MAELRAIVFDFNGVIIDDEPIHLIMFRRVLEEEGLGVSDEDYHEKYIGFDDRGFFHALFKANGREIGPALNRELIARFSDQKWLGEFPFLSEQDRSDQTKLAEYAERALDLDAILGVATD